MVEPYSGLMLPIVARLASGTSAETARTVELDELADDAVLAQLLGDDKHEVSRVGTPAA